MGTRARIACESTLVQFQGLFTQTPCQTKVKKLASLKDHFWRRWRKEYLLDNGIYRRNPTCGALVGVGDIVIIHEDGLQRGLWKLGRVDKLISGKDGIVRGAVVRSTTKQRRSTMLRRPLQKLYPVECDTRQEEVPVAEATSQACKCR